MGVGDFEFEVQPGDHSSIKVFHLIIPFLEGFAVGRGGVPNVTFDFLEEATAASIDFKYWLVA